MIKTIIFILFLIFPLPAIAGLDRWEKAGTNSAAGPARPGTAYEYYITTASGDETETLTTLECSKGTVTCFGDTVTGVVQLCDRWYAKDLTASVYQCKNMTDSTIDCTTGHSFQIDPMPGHIRIASITNEGATEDDFFLVTCSP